ncbi:hypothetical protein NM208_g3893 [Fusarium decemcellulare]|uniref:Uncharacterized protein n=1 Tax=Fusarium decemcellulare TaxID=57161 RepID=A0ACC1SMK7_9HYPO|nr:hypothetical protein NM208_g3893 [Fusarium decemcellulare]
MQQQALDHKRLTREKVGKRLALKDPRPDFFQGLITGTGDLCLSREQLESNGEVITMAGSETTASLLGGAVYQLTTHPRVMTKLCEEITASFKSEDEITLISAGRLPYLCAVTEESLRTFPPGTNTQPRITPPEGNVILGDHVPGNTVIGIPHRAMYYTESNFKRAHEFIPERWMNDPEFASDRRDCFKPFGVGPRSCLGVNLAYAEFRLILARLLFNFEVTLEDRSRNWMAEQRSYLFWEKSPFGLDFHGVTFDSEQLSGDLMSFHIGQGEPIAIVGSACRLAGDATSPSKLWELLRDPRDIRSEIPSSRFDAKAFYHPDHAHHGHSNVMHSYFMGEDVTVFDAEFFSVKPMEAKAMDPQQRILMEVVYEAIEAGGMTIEGLKGSDTSVYAGVMCGDFEAMNLRDLNSIPIYSAVGTSRAILSNRVSYFFDWHGPSVTIDTACSSSLVAIHSGVQALRAGETTMVVACGSNVILGPENYILESKLKMLSPDGVGKMWDRDANGYARGEGVAAVVLKLLSKALADGDHIECLIKQTAVNQDGFTPGITMPSSAAQADLIRSTYARAGLDATVYHPQYFEAHGTGTPAGDPAEAEAISKAFFGNEAPERSEEPLYVGSIKTTHGHTEGTAGIAAILKASLALQNALIPPNLLFDNLSPDVAPFYENLEILKTAKPWPAVAPGQPRRASVNSFGFGGTNAHAILESYQNSISCNSAADYAAGEASVNTLFTPFLFSASSQHSLHANLLAYAAYLEEHPATSPLDLSYTLRQRRSALKYRISLPATSSEDLRSQIAAKLDNNDGTNPLGVRAQRKSKILAIFTGQGAQYVGMGVEMIKKSPFARNIIRKLEYDLSQLKDAPNWSLQSELLAIDGCSRVQEAAISQPLCTAIQIMLVDLFREAHVEFDAVIGHSSGEIAAAYAAGYLSARDAICVAYYRGLHCQYAASPNGSMKGSMLAVGTSFEDATALCEMEEFAGRVSIAAVNSSSSVTISGDEDAIEELQVIFDDEKKFNRLLKVDQAYHSKHMLPCVAPYVEAMQLAGVKTQSHSSQCTWFSSVYDGQPVNSSDFILSDSYWAGNMTSPVLFSAAIGSALRASTEYGAVLEFGAHPALKGPASQTIQETLEKAIPYHGTLVRGADAIQSISASLGFVWSHLDIGAVDLDNYNTVVSGQEVKKQRFNLIKGLPAYKWNHETSYWHESRVSRHMRHRQQTFHSLLGHVSPESAPHSLRWTNVLKPNEIDWLEGHKLQNQIVFPAAGYASTAFEAARSLPNSEQSIKLIELRNFRIHQAIMFDADDTAIDVLIELSNISTAQPNRIDARFTYSAHVGGQDADLALAADAEVVVLLGTPLLNLLPTREPTPPHLIDVEPWRLYDFMTSLGYNFSGRFRSLATLSRKLGKACCSLTKAPTDDPELLLAHPAELDAAFQSVMLAYSYPGDCQLRTLHLPTGIRTLRLNPALCTCRRPQLEADSVCRREDRSRPGLGFSGHVNVYSEGHRSAAIQADGISFVPFAGAINEDRNVFYKLHWVLSKPDGTLAAKDFPVTQHDNDLMWALSRIAAYYLRKFDDEIPEDSPVRSDGYLRYYLAYARHMTASLRAGTHKYGKVEWIHDTAAVIREELNIKGLSSNPDVQLMFVVGEKMPQVFAGETTAIEHLRSSGLLDEYYADGFGMFQSCRWLGQIVKQITDRHPHVDILEIGAGTGSATKHILDTIDQSFNRYTYTDISSSFFENAGELFSKWKDHMDFKVLDAEKSPAQQGFAEGSFDLLIASFVLHATSRLENTMHNLRRLMKPGGLLVVAEGSSDGPLQAGDSFIFGSLPGWWLGAEEGRTLTPLVNVDDWERILKNTGFSGIDTISPPDYHKSLGIILFVSQAIDDRITLLREPLSAMSGPDKLIIVGGQTNSVDTMVRQLEELLHWTSKEIIVYASLEQVDYNIVTAGSVVLSLTELDAPVFKNLTPDRWYSFRSMFEQGKTLLWVTSGRLEDSPWSNMTVGFGRSAVQEIPDLRLQFLDIPDVGNCEPRMIAETLLRLYETHVDDGSAIVTTIEPEIIMDAEGRQHVARLHGIRAMNDRYNSAQHPITHQIDMDKSIVELQPDPYGGSPIRKLSRFEVYDAFKQGKDTTMVELRITHSVLSAIRTPIGHQFLVLGVDPKGIHHLALVSSLTSRSSIPKSSTAPCDLEWFEDAAAFLINAVAQLVALTILDSLVAGHRVAVHNFPDLFSQALSTQAIANNIRVLHTNDRTECASWRADLDHVTLAPYMSRSQLEGFFPDNIACFASLSGREKTESELLLLSSLPLHCRRETAETLFCSHAVESTVATAGILGLILDKVVTFAKGSTSRQSQDAQPELPITSLESLASNSWPDDPMMIIDWTSATSLPARVSRLDSMPLFKSDKTYWVCGMSGPLGISLCDWMIERGSKYLVITSRNPKIEAAWVGDHKRRGVTIKLMPCDVTDEKSLRAVHQQIVETLPQIVGVLNGAMVLRDVSIANMTFEQLTDVIYPKVLGSENLDRIFYDNNLDFFANYGAANLGLCGIAANRRKRGLASSVVNVGAIIGAGYLQRQRDSTLDATVHKMAMMPLSEEDLHQMFAEAIEAGNPDSPDGPEISTGLLDIVPESTAIPKWFFNPKFSHFVFHKAASTRDTTEQTTSTTIQDQLQGCRSRQDVVNVIKECFVAQLRKLLLTSASDDELLSARSQELGFDSLISVDIRTWFLKNFQVGIPVLKIMGNHVMTHLAEFAAENIPAELIPGVTQKEEENQPKDGEAEFSSESSHTTPEKIGAADTTSTESLPITNDSSTDGSKADKTTLGDIDWDTEACPPDTVTQPASTTPCSNPPRVVLITGSTGLLGRHLLNTLLKTLPANNYHRPAIGWSIMRATCETPF